MSVVNIWQVVIQKQLGTEYWVNDYHIVADGLEEAQSRGLAIAQIERAIHKTDVGFVNYRVRPAVSVTQGTVFPIGLAGQVGSDNYAPLYNTVRVDFTAPSGRPGRKYLRTPISSAAIQNGQLSSGALASYQTNYCTPIINLGYVCKENADIFIAAAPAAAVQMRQLRRGSKRRLQPII